MTEYPLCDLDRMARGFPPLFEQFDLWENARLFGLLNMAMADGYIASWEVKYHYSFWRPITAIREGDNDGNRATQGDSTWTPLEPTYPIPDHDSAPTVCRSRRAARRSVLAGRARTRRR